MSEELSRVEDLLENGVEEPVLPMSELEAILRGEKIKPHSRVAELLLQYNPQDILIEKSITENGTYYASVDNADGYFKVIVDTPVVPPTVLDHLVETITENGEYTYTPEHDGYSDAEITVNVPSVQPVVASKTITANGTYVAADEQLDGYSQAVVNVPATPLDTMNITHNGTYHPPAGRGFDEVNVTVPLGSKSITANGTYTATDDNLDGYSSVAVDVPQIGIKDIPNTPTPIATFSDGTSNPLKSLTASIVPVQAGSGDPSPTNVRPISGWDEVNVTRTGKNLYGGIDFANSVKDASLSGAIDTTNKTVAYSYGTGSKTTIFDTFKPLTSYTFLFKVADCSGQNFSMRIVYTDGTTEGIEILTSDIGNYVRKVSDPNKTVRKLAVMWYQPTLVKLYYDECGIFEGNIQVTDFEPYNGQTYTIPFTDGQGQSVEVFGGSVDVVNGGEQPQTLGSVDLGELEWVYDANIRCWNINIQAEWNMKGVSNNQQVANATAEQFKLRKASGMSASVAGELAVDVSMLRANTGSDNEAPKGLLVYELATPTTFYTQPTSIKSLDGDNNVFASTGEILSGQYFGYVYPELGTKTITENGTYTATDDNLDGYSEVTINVAGGGGETKYYEYIRALDGQVIVRVEYPDAERTYATKTLWFFNGYYTDGGDNPIPDNLWPYLPWGYSSTVLLTSGYSDSTSESQLGWVGLVYPNYRDRSYTKFRTWNMNKGQTMAGTFWGVLDINGGEEQITEWFDPYENVPPRQIKNYGGTIEDGYNLNTELKTLGNVYHDSAMSYEIDNDSFDITWNESGAYIGFSFNGDVDLKASDIQRLSYKIDFGTCYDAARNQNIRPFIIGVTDTIRTTPSTGVYFDPSQVDNYFTKYKMYYKDVCNTTVEDFVDISDIDGPCYLFIVATGWIASITDLSMVSNCTPQIGTTLSQFNFFNYVSEDSNANKIIPIDTESFDVYWSGAIYIGHCLTGNIPLSGKKRLDIDMDYIGENYQHSSGTHTRNHNLAIVVTDIKVDSYVNLDNLERDNHIIAIKEWDGNDIYGQSIHTSIDLSNISGEYYINYQLPGFNIDGFRARLYSNI